MIADLLIKNASELLTCSGSKPKTGKELSDLGIIKNGSIAVKDGKIFYIGDEEVKAKKVIDASGKIVMPGFVDCHTHSVFAGSRENEFVKKLQGADYLSILKGGGGILSTVEATRKTTKQELFKLGVKRLDGMLKYGTTTVEIKSGYGLNFETEKKILEVAEKLNKTHSIDIVKTYLGAHTVPKDKKKEEYIQDIINSLKEIKPLAEFCDIFCEKGVFTVEESKKILTAAKNQGFKLKLHSEQLNTLNSAKLAAELNAISADHLDHISDSGIEKMSKAGVIGVLLPGVPFYLREEKYAPARKMIDKGMALALASDFNPGSCPSFNLQLMLSLACIKMKLLPAEAINCATINAAFAIDRGKEIGSLEVGKKADILVVNAPNHNYLPYNFGINLVEKVIKNGKLVVDNK